jgi:hypothetical protein
MNTSTPYVTPQERRRQKAIERQLPTFRPATDGRPAEADGLRREPPSPTRR